MSSNRTDSGFIMQHPLVVKDSDLAVLSLLAATSPNYPRKEAMKYLPVIIFTWVWCLCWMVPTLILVRIFFNDELGKRWARRNVSLWCAVLCWFTNKQVAEEFRALSLRGLDE